MSRFTKNKITTAISTVLLLSSSYAFAADNLIHKICGNGIIVDVFEHLFQKIVPFL